LVGERIDWGLAAVRMQIAGGKLRDFLPPWYDTDDSGGMWALFGRLTEPEDDT